MASFDFVGAAAAGYRFVWRERGRIARYALPLFVVKIALFVILTSFGLHIPPLRQGLFLLPAYVIEGWMLAVLIRYYAQAPQDPREASRATLSATLIYVLIKLFLAVTAALTLAAAPETAQAQTPSPPTLREFAAALIAFAVMIWAFRLLWFYVPAAFGYPLRRFAEKIAAYKTSFYMIGAWLICTLPAGFLFLLFLQAFLAGLPEEAEPGAFLRFSMLAAQTVVEIFVSVVTSIAMAEGVRSMLFDKK